MFITHNTDTLVYLYSQLLLAIIAREVLRNQNEALS